MAKSYPDIGTFSSGQILTAVTMNEVADNLDGQRSPAMTIAELTASQSIPNATDTVLTFGSKTVETDTGMYGTNKIVIKTAGVYMVQASMIWEADGDGVRYMVIRKNATGVASNLNAALNSATIPDATRRHSQNIAMPLSLAVNDELDIQVYHSAGAALTVNVYGAQMTATWVGQTT